MLLSMRKTDFSTKTSQKYFEGLKDELNRLIKIGRTWKLEDYRCIDWIKRLTNTVVEIKDFFENDEIVMNESDAVKIE